MFKLKISRSMLQQIIQKVWWTHLFVGHGVLDACLEIKVTVRANTGRKNLTHWLWELVRVVPEKFAVLQINKLDSIARHIPLENFLWQNSCTPGANWNQENWTFSRLELTFKVDVYTSMDGGVQKFDITIKELIMISNFEVSNVENMSITSSMLEDPHKQRFSHWLLALSFNCENLYLLKNQSQRRFDYLLFDIVKQSIQYMSLCDKAMCSDMTYIHLQVIH